MFLREATGLVRSWSTTDAFMYVTLQLSVGLWTVFTISTNAFAWPGGNALVGGIFATLLFACPSAVYAMLAAAMPRSGGDYVFQTRILRIPFVTYIAMGIWLIGNAWFIPYIWSAVAGAGWAPFLAILGVETGNKSLLSLATWITSRDAIFAFGLFVVFWMWLVNAFGLRNYARVQKVFFLAAIVLSVVYYSWLALTPQQTFINSFNAVAPALGGASTNAYQAIIDLAAKNGYAPDFSFSWYQSLANVASWSAIFVVGYYTALCGEIKRGDSLSGQMKISVGGGLFVGVLVTVFAVVIENMVGHQFNAAAGYLWFNGQWPLIVPPYAGLYSVVLGGIAMPLTVLLFINSWTWMNYPNVVPYNTRISMAMAFDRMLPEKMAEVNERWHIPLFNTNVWCLVTLGLVFLAYFLTTFGQLFLVASFCLSFVLALSCLAGAVFPYAKWTKQLYETSAVAKYKVGKIPAITILGIISVLLEVFVDYLFLTNPGLGIAGGNFTISLSFLGVLAVFFGALYVWYKYYNKRRGIDVSMAFQQVPPE